MKLSKSEILPPPSKYQVLITGPGVQLKAWMDGQFSMNITSQFEPLFSTSADVANKNIAQLNAFIDTNIPMIKPVGASMLYYTGSEFSDLQIPIVILALEPGDDVTKDVLALQKAALPIADGLTIKTDYDVPRSTAQVLPLNSASGTFSIKVGTWFVMHGLLLKSVDVTFSKTILKSGKPAYARVNLLFTPWRSVVRSDANWFL